MRIYCRYLLQNYFKVFFLGLFSFISILLLTRLRFIASFATYGTPIKELTLFILYQITYVLPMAIPPLALLSSFLLAQRLSHTHELTAFRAGGLSLFKVMAPVVCAALFLAVGTFYLTSEIATTCHLKTRKMVYDLTSVNPLLLLSNAQVGRLKDAYVEMDSVHKGHQVRDLLVAIPGHSMMLCLAKGVEIQEDALLCSDLSLVTTSSDHLAIENVRSARSPAIELAHLIQTKGWKISHDHLNWRLLQARKRSLAGQKSVKAQKSLVKINSEMTRRFSSALAPLSFSLLGIASGMRRKVLIVVFLTAATLISFFIGKEFDHLFFISLAFYGIPHLCIGAYSLRTLHQIRGGLR